MRQVKLANGLSIPSFGSQYRYDDSSEGLGEGAVGKVYSGTSDTGIPVAIKTATSEEALAGIQNEYQQLKLLRDYAASKDGSNYAHLFPEAVLADDGKPESPVLVMPRYDVQLKKKLRGLIQENDVMAAELLALDSAIQYTYALEMLHGSLNQTCTDRKIEDFFFLPDGSDMVIIDWNVLRESSAEMFSSEVEKLGDLWHELMVGSAGQKPLQPYDDQFWQLTPAPIDGGVMSIGLRAIIAQMVHTDSKMRFVDDSGMPSQHRLRDVLTEWKKLLTGSGTPSVNDLPTALHLTPEEADAVVVDLRWRKQRTNRRLQDDRTDALERLANTRDPKDVIVNHLNRGDWDAAAQTVTHLLESPEKAVSASADPALRNHLLRWKILLALGSWYKANAGMNLRRAVDEELRTKVKRIGLTLHIDPVNDRSSELRSAIQDVEDVQNILESVRRDDSPETAAMVADNERKVASLLGELNIRWNALQYRRSGLNFVSEKAHLLPENKAIIEYIRELIQKNVIPYIDSDTAPLMQRILDLNAEEKKIQAEDQRVKAEREESDKKQRQQIVTDVSENVNTQATTAVKQAWDAQRSDLDQIIASQKTKLDGDIQKSYEALEEKRRAHEAVTTQFLADYNRQHNDASTAITGVNERLEQIKSRLTVYENLDKKFSTQQEAIDANGNRIAAFEAQQRTLSEFARFEMAVYSDFDKGDRDGALQKLNDIRARFSKPGEVNLVIREILREWVERIHYADHLNAHLDSVGQWLDVVKDSKPQADLWHTLNRVIADLDMALRDCPLDAFSPMLHDKWQKTFDRVVRLAAEIATKVKNLPTVADPGYNAMKNAASLKHKAYCQYYVETQPGN